MPIIIAGRFKVDVTVTTSASADGLIGSVSPTATLFGPVTGMDYAANRVTSWASWGQAAQSDEVYEFNKAADALLAAAGVPERNRPHPELWRYQGDERDIQKQMLLQRRPDLNVLPRRVHV